MSEAKILFRKKSEIKSFDQNHSERIKFNTSRYDKAVSKGLSYYADLDLAKSRAVHLKNKVINNLDKYLIEFESQFLKNGGKVVYATDGANAVSEIVKILKEREISSVVKSKSMTTEELDFNEKLEAEKITAFETDLGEFIVQQAGEKPYHIVTPAMHMSRKDVADLFAEKFDTKKDATPEELTAFTRKHLRNEFLKAGAGITGANFLIANIGAVALTENEGNGVMSMAFPKLHIVIAGIEKVIPSIKNLDTFWPLLSRFGTGQQLTTYNTIISGPAREGEADGPEEMIVVLLNNNRTKILEQNPQQKALTCIRCGACLNACPIYRLIGGHTYGTTYSGPIGSVITPLMKGLKEYNHLSFSCTLCGKCSEVCPMEIPLPELMLENRRMAVEAGHNPLIWKAGLFGMKTVMKNRWMMDAFGGGFKNKVVPSLVKKMWGPRREFPEFSKQSFRKMWESRRGM